MKDLKHCGINSKTLLATSILTTLSYLNANTAIAQQTAATADIATCQTLSDNTSLDKNSIENYINCYSRDVEHLNHLVEQLVAEREQLLSTAEDNATVVENFQQELAQRQEALQRLEQRAAALNTQIDELTNDRNQLREQLYNTLSEGKDRSIGVEASERLFESFSESYVTQSIEIEELKRRLKAFEEENSKLTADQSINQESREQLSSANQELESKNRELQDNLAKLEQSVTDLNEKNVQLQSELDGANNQITAMKSQLMDNAAIATERLDQITDLKSALADSQTERDKLKDEISALNNKHLEEVQALNEQTEKLNAEIETLKSRQFAMQDQAKIAADKSQLDIKARSAKIAAIQKQLQDTSALSVKRLNQINELRSREYALRDQAKIAASKNQLDINARNAKIAAIQKQLQDTSALSVKRLNQINELRSREYALLDQAKVAADKSQSDLKVRNAKILELARARFNINKERENLVEQIGLLEASHLAKTQEFQNRASQLEDQIASLDLEKSAMQEQLQNQQAENEKLTAEALSSNQKNADLNTASNALRGKLRDADTTVTNLQADIDKLGKQSDAQKALFLEQLTKLNSTIEQSKKNQNMLSNELDTVKPLLATAERDLKTSNRNNEILTAEVQDLGTQLQKAANEQQGLQASLAATKQESESASKRLSGLKRDTEILKSLLSMSRTHSKNADKTLSELRSELNASDQRLNTKQAELDALLAEKTRIENDFKAIASQASSQAAAIKTAMTTAGHDDVEIEVGDDNTIGILLGSGQLFKTGSSLLSRQGQQVLMDLARSFETIENRRIMINGHSDNVPLGEKLSQIFKDNWGLSLARALATAEYFTDEADIAADRMTVAGFGATQPVASNDTPEGRQQNRRVEIRLAPTIEKMVSAQ